MKEKQSKLPLNKFQSHEQVFTHVSKEDCPRQVYYHYLKRRLVKLSFRHKFPKADVSKGLLNVKKEQEEQCPFFVIETHSASHRHV